MRVRGSVAPARAGVAGRPLDRRARRRVVRRLDHGADGTFVDGRPALADDPLRAVAGGIALADAHGHDVLEDPDHGAATGAAACSCVGSVSTRPARTGAAAAHDRRHGLRADLRAQRAVQVPLQGPPSRPLPGRVHSIQRPRRAVHFQQRSRFDEVHRFSHRSPWRWRHWPFRHGTAHPSVYTDIAKDRANPARAVPPPMQTRLRGHEPRLHSWSCARPTARPRRRGRLLKMLPGG